jgi:hypothetical protein
LHRALDPDGGRQRCERTVTVAEYGDQAVPLVARTR